MDQEEFKQHEQQMMMYDMDYMVYYQEYDDLKKKVWKPRGDATRPGKIEHFGAPLDFSFLKLQDVISLRKKRPRAGKRKPIEKDEDEDDVKKDQAGAGMNAEDVDGDKPDQKKDLVIKNQSIPQVNAILSNHSISLTATKNGMLGGRKPEDGKEEAQKKKEINYVVNTILLNNNEIRDLVGFNDTLSTYVLHEPERLQWLNLSYNYLVKIDAEILKFKQLKSLQLHGNFIADLEEVRKLNELGTLQCLTLNGNEIEKIKGYRLYVLGLMFAKYETLRKFDTVIITRTEFDNVLVWNERLYAGMQNKLRRLKPAEPKKPPAKEEDENAKNGGAGGN